MRNNDGTRTVTFVVAAVVTLTACGGSTAVHSARTSAATGRQAASAVTPPQKDYTHYYPPGTHPAPRTAVRVIRSWSDQLRAGHARRAATYFALRVLVENGSPPERLTSRRQILAWNRSLPCGAHLVRTLAGSRYTVATFVLTESPGPLRCDATGMLAAVAFLVRDGRITEWRRVLVPPPLGPAQNLSESGAS